MKRVLLIGGGAREHALAWTLSRSSHIEKLFWAPGSDAVTGYERWPLPSEGDWSSLARQAKAQGITLLVVGPDNPLAEGIVDAFKLQGIACFGPTRAASQIEASKVFAKEVMWRAGIPTARFEVIEASTWKGSFGPEWAQGGVVKVDGLAFGKGVVVCADATEMVSAARELFRISPRLVVEERVHGKEVSWMALCDGQKCTLLDTARDYKRLGDADVGPNTGGMGAFSPVAEVPESWKNRIRREVFEPALADLARTGAPFCGVLYAGLMVDVPRDRYWVLEFNARFGDPEAQVLLPRVKEDLLPWLWDAALGTLPSREIEFDSSKAVYVVGAAPGYPAAPQRGLLVTGTFSRKLSGEIPERFFAGVQETGNHMVTAGGRVLGGLGMAATWDDARRAAYNHLASVSFEGMRFRKDIASENGGSQ